MAEIFEMQYCIMTVSVILKRCAFMNNVYNCSEVFVWKWCCNLQPVPEQAWKCLRTAWGKRFRSLLKVYYIVLILTCLCIDMRARALFEAGLLCMTVKIESVKNNWSVWTAYQKFVTNFQSLFFVVWRLIKIQYIFYSAGSMIFHFYCDNNLRIK